MTGAIRTRVDADGAVVGAICVLGAAGVDALDGSGAAFALLDCQHGPYDENAAAAILRARRDGDVPVLVRVSQRDAALIGRLADAGADGIVVPLVDDPADAEAAVAALGYPPHGVRSYGPSRAGLPADTAELTARVDLFVMIETGRGLQSAERIAATPGIAGVMVGPMDLGIALGVAPAEVIGSPTVRAAMERIRSACDRAGVVPASFAFSAAHARTLLALGYRLVTGPVDRRLIADGAAAEITAILGRRAENEPAATIAYP